MTGPTNEDYDDLILSCRYGDIDDVRLFVDKFGVEATASARDENGNTVLHMVSANGHDGGYPDLPSPASPLVTPLSTKQFKIHTAALAATNKHLSIVQKLAGAQPSLIDIKNGAGRTPLGEQSLWNGMKVHNGWYKLVFFTPVGQTQRVLSALFKSVPKELGTVGQIGLYQECAFVSQGTGQFRPMAGANPSMGDIGQAELVQEEKAEVVVSAGPDTVKHVIQELRKASPHSTPTQPAIPSD
ncbi:Structural toxin protein [Rhizoctonia solani]|uniref:ATP phosphoribosyltransferase n=1 Tax=Rhizoctonia solani TaxID=456999 RepID=A0A8H7M7L3_9AGAM|nr:Structural toxin protein [Rhizoctonia solani]